MAIGKPNHIVCTGTNTEIRTNCRIMTNKKGKR
jgi:hypothetical protein